MDRINFSLLKNYESEKILYPMEETCRVKILNGIPGNLLFMSLSCLCQRKIILEVTKTLIRLAEIILTENRPIVKGRKRSVVVVLFDQQIERNARIF